MLAHHHHDLRHQQNESIIHASITTTILTLKQETCIRWGDGMRARVEARWSAGGRFRLTMTTRDNESLPSLWLWRFRFFRFLWFPLDASSSLWSSASPPSSVAPSACSRSKGFEASKLVAVIACEGIVDVVVVVVRDEARAPPPLLDDEEAVADAGILCSWDSRLRRSSSDSSPVARWSIEPKMSSKIDMATTRFASPNRQDEQEFEIFQTQTK